MLDDVKVKAMVPVKKEEKVSVERVFEKETVRKKNVSTCWRKKFCNKFTLKKNIFL